MYQTTAGNSEQRATLLPADDRETTSMRARDALPGQSCGPAASSSSCTSPSRRTSACRPPSRQGPPPSSLCHRRPWPSYSHSYLPRCRSCRQPERPSTRYTAPRVPTPRFARAYGPSVFPPLRIVLLLCDSAALDFTRKEGEMVHKWRSTSPAFSPPQAQAVESMERVRSFVRHVSRHGYGVGFHREGLLLVPCRLAEPWWRSPSRWWIRLHLICTLFARFQHFAQECHRWCGTPALEFSW